MFLTKTNEWYIERIVWLVAGIFVLGSTILSHVHTPYWSILTLLVGLNLLVLTFTGFCPMTAVLGAFGLPSHCAREKRS